MKRGFYQWNSQPGTLIGMCYVQCRMFYMSHIIRKIKITDILYTDKSMPKAGNYTSIHVNFGGGSDGFKLICGSATLVFANF